MTPVSAICIGQPQPFNGAELSAIAKQPVAGRVAIREFGIEGDMVADTRHHGGPDMAVHQYPKDHYPMWNTWLGGHALLQRPAAFGENIIASGMTEDWVCIGDRFQLGTAILEVSQPRQPCWKIEHRFGSKGMVRHIIKSHFCGWYYRVLEEGHAEAGDHLERIESGHPDWSVAKLFAALFDPASKPSRADLAEIAALARLCMKWREKAQSKLSQ